MARNPTILKGVAAMCRAVYAPGEISQGLKRLIGYIASTAAGCKYCQVHTAHGAHEQGVDDAKILAAWDYEASDLFSDAERRRYVCGFAHPLFGRTNCRDCRRDCDVWVSKPLECDYGYRIGRDAAGIRAKNGRENTVMLI